MRFNARLFAMMAVAFVVCATNSEAQKRTRKPAKTPARQPTPPPEIGLVSDPVYNQRIQRALTTISTMDLFDGAAFNKSYDSKTGRMIDRNQRISSRGYGWSVTDIGRLLTWLRILAVNQPQFSSQATPIVNRLNMYRLISPDGYLLGQDIEPRTGQTRIYTEGR